MKRKKRWIMTLAVKTVKERIVWMDLAWGGRTRWRRQIKEVNWPRFKESPTNINLFPLRASSINVALKLHIIQFSIIITLIIFKLSVSIDPRFVLKTFCYISGLVFLKPLLSKWVSYACRCSVNPKCVLESCNLLRRRMQLIYKIWCYY